MNKEIREIIRRKVGQGVIVSFYDIDESQGGYESGIIDEVTNTILKIRYKTTVGAKKGITGGPLCSNTTYIDIASIKSISFSDPDMFDENGLCIY